MIKLALILFVSILFYSYPLNVAVAATLLAQNGYCASSASNVVTVTEAGNGRGWTSPPVWYAIEWIYSDNIIHVDIMNKNTDQEFVYPGPHWCRLISWHDSGGCE